MGKIKKEDLPAEVVEYIDGLEDTLEEALDTNEQLGKSLEQANAKITEQANELIKHGVAKNDPLEELLAKADPAVAEVLKAQRAELDRQQEAISKAQEASFRAEMVAKADELPFITVEKSELAELLAEAHRIPAPVAKEGEQQPESFGAKLDRILTAANNQLRDSDIYKQFGQAASGEATVTGSVQSMAQELVKSDPNLDMATAIARVYEENPSLYDEELKER